MTSRAPRAGTIVMLRVFGHSDRPTGLMSTVRSTTLSTACASTIASAAPRQRRIPPPNGIHVAGGGLLPRNRSGRNSSGEG